MYLSSTGQLIKSCFLPIIRGKLQTTMVLGCKLGTNWEVHAEENQNVAGQMVGYSSCGWYAVYDPEAVNCTDAG
jgi:hypothetical protein